MQKTLKEFKQGEKGTVLRVTAQGGIKRRLFDMGITPGAEISMKKAAPLGDPIEISIRGYELSVRKTEAEAVLLNTKGEK
ncbi:MAG: FeoA family protein [Clostridiaceae bacterium]|nr:FeoA family protein [Clostridiaceae bacterium]